MIRVLLLGLIFAVCLHAEVPTVTAANLRMLDTDEHLSQLTGEDRLTKAALKNHGLDVIILNTAITEYLSKSSAGAVIASDLARGDIQLVSALKKTLATLNFSFADADRLVLHWANTGTDDSLSSLLEIASKTPESRAPLVDYIMGVDRLWLREVAFVATNAHSINLRQSLINTGTLSISNLDLLLQKLITADIETRWSIMGLVQNAVQTGGSIYQIINVFDLPKTSFYEGVWDNVDTIVAGDPLLFTNLAASIKNLSPFSRVINEVLLESLSSEELVQSLSDGLSIGSKDVNSRWGTIAELTSTGKKLSTEEWKTHLPRLLRQNQSWRDWIFWHLTRPAEAVSLTIRAGLAGVIPEVATDMIKSSPLFGSCFEHSISKEGAYSIYKDAVTTRSAVISGGVDPTAMAKYAEVAAHALSTDDEVWNEAVAKSEHGPDSIFRKIINASIFNDPAAAQAWLQTVAHNDEIMRSSFIEWLISEGMVDNKASANEWLNSTAKNTGDIIRFKTFFTKWIATSNGWNMAWRRLAVESTAIPSKIRTLLVSVLVEKTSLLWSTYQSAAAGDNTASKTLRVEVATALLQSGLSRLLLQENAAGNPLAADAANALWKIVIAPDSPILTAIEGEISTGVTQSSVYVNSVRSFGHILENPVLWKQVAPLASSHLHVTTASELISVIYSNSRESTTFIQNAMLLPQVREGWRKDMIKGAALDNRSNVLATFIQAREDLLPLWDNAFITIISNDSHAPRTIIENLAIHKLGETSSSQAAIAARKLVASVLVKNRYIFENLVDNPSGELRKLSEKVATKAFGEYNGDIWKKSLY